MPAPGLGIRIKRARERKRWTQRQLADALGVDIKSVDNWENGRTRPRNRIGALEEVLGISLSGQEAPGPLDDLYPLQEPWEQLVIDDEGLTDEWKRELITGGRAGRAASEARRREREARSARDRGREAG